MKIPAMRLLPAFSFFLMLFLAASALHAQEAPGEGAPGMRTTREPEAGKPLSAEERKELNNMFSGELEEEKKPEEKAVPQRMDIDEIIKQGDKETPALGPVIAPLPSPSLYMDNTRTLSFLILNKQTARLYTKELTEGSSLTYGPLAIKLLECWHSAPDAAPDSAALMQITEARPDGGKPKQLFLGWMFASSPSLNPLEHPVYDITIKECR